MLSVTDNQGRNVDYNKDTIFVFLMIQVMKIFVTQTIRFLVLVAVSFSRNTMQII